MVRGFKLINGVLTYSPKGGLVQKTVNLPAMPSDSPEFDKLATQHGVPADQLRAAFGTLSPTSPVAPTPAPKAAETPVKEAVAAAEEEPKTEDKPKKKAKSKKSGE